MPGYREKARKERNATFFDVFYNLPCNPLLFVKQFLDYLLWWTTYWREIPESRVSTFPEMKTERM